MRPILQRQLPEQEMEPGLEWEQVLVQAQDQVLALVPKSGGFDERACR